MVQTVSHHEFVLYLESDIFDSHVDFTAARLAQQAGGPQGFRIAGAEHILKVMESQPRIDDVFDDNDVAALQWDVEVLEKTNLARTLGGRAITRHGDEIKSYRAGRHRASKVGKKHERALQHGYKVQRVAAWIVAVDARGQFVDTLLNLLCSE